MNKTQVEKVTAKTSKVTNAATKTTAKAKPVAKPKTTEVINPPVDIYDNKPVLLEASKRAKQIHTELGKVESSFSRIAFNLHWIYENDAYKPLGFKNVYDFAKIEFGIARGTCSNFINVVDRFAKRIDGKIVEEIDDCYKGYKSSQLILMLELSDNEIKKLDCGMSVRDMKKEIKKIVGEDAISDNASAPVEQEETIVDVESKEVNRQVLITVSTLEEYDTQEDKIYSMIKRALKDPSHKIEIAYTW